MYLITMQAKQSSKQSVNNEDNIFVVLKHFKVMLSELNELEIIE